MMCSGPLLFENILQKNTQRMQKKVSPAALPGRGRCRPASLPDGCASPRRIRWGYCLRDPEPALRSLRRRCARQGRWCRIPARCARHCPRCTPHCPSGHRCPRQSPCRRQGRTPVRPVRRRSPRRYGCASRQGCCCTPAHRRCRRSRPCPRRAAWRQAQLNCWQARMRPAVRRVRAPNQSQTAPQKRTQRVRAVRVWVRLPQILRRRSRAAAIHRPPVGQG